MDSQPKAFQRPSALAKAFGQLRTAYWPQTKIVILYAANKGSTVRKMRKSTVTLPSLYMPRNQLSICLQLVFLHPGKNTLMSIPGLAIYLLVTERLRSPSALPSRRVPEFVCSITSHLLGY